jgi:putative ABC transport system permease protein
MQMLVQDLRYGIRMLGKNLGFLAVAVVTLALGIGANTAIFSIVNAVLFRPLPYPQPERLLSAHWGFARGETPNLTSRELVFLRDNSRSFEDVAAYSGLSSGFNLASGPEPQRVRGMRATGALFRTLGLPLAIGRGFLPEEDVPGGPYSVVISDGLWRAYFGADPAAVGRQIELNGRGCNIVGILPRGVQFDAGVDIVAPMQLDPAFRSVEDEGHNVKVIARLKVGITRLDALDGGACSSGWASSIRLPTDQFPCCLW